MGDFGGLPLAVAVVAVTVAGLFVVSGTASAAHDTAVGLHVEGANDNVDGDGQAGAAEDGDGDSVYGTLAGALGNATVSATVEVAEGTFREAVTVSTPDVTLRGDPASEAGGSGSGSGAASSAPKLVGGDELDVGVTVEAANVTVEGLAVHNYTVNGIEVTSAGADATVRSNTVVHSTSAVYSRAGINVEDAGSVTVAENRVEDNEVGIRLLGSPSSLVANNTVTRNGEGIQVADSSLTTIASNLVDDNEYGGIHVTSYPQYLATAVGRFADVGLEEAGLQAPVTRLTYGGALGGQQGQDGAGVETLPEQASLARDELDERGLLPNGTSNASAIGAEVSAGDRLAADLPASIDEHLDLPASSPVADLLARTLTEQRVNASGPSLAANTDPLADGLHGHVVERNVVEDNGDHGLRIEQTRGDRVAHNTIRDNPDEGLLLVDSRDATLRSNAMTANGDSFGVSSLDDYYYAHDIDTSNTIDGSPILYIVGESDVRVAPGSHVADPAFVALVNTQGATVEDLSLEGPGENLLLVGTSGTQVRDVTVANTSGAAIDLTETVDVTIANATLAENEIGVQTYEAENTHVDASRFDRHEDAVQDLRSTGTHVENVTIKNAGDGTGVYASQGTGLVVESSTIEHAAQGVYLVGSQDATVRDNEMQHTAIGVFTPYATGTLVEANTVQDATVGVTLYFADGGRLTANTVTGSQGAVLAVETTGTRIEQTHARGNQVTGFLLVASSDLVLRSNDLADSGEDLVIQGLQPRHYDHDIDTSNTVTGGPVVYHNQATDVSVTADTEAGYVGLVNTTDATVQDVSVSSGGQGIVVAGGDAASLTNVTVADTVEAVRAVGTSNLSLARSTVQDSGYGVLLAATQDAEVSQVEAEDNTIGIAAVGSQRPALVDNQAHRNDVGIFVYLSSRASLEDNRMEDNRFGLDVLGETLGDYRHDIDTSNTVEGDPVRYLLDAEDVTIDGAPTGYLAVVDATNVTVRDLHVEANGQGATVFGSEDVTVENVTVADAIDGFLLVETTDAELANVSATGSGTGLLLFESPATQVHGSHLASNEIGALAVGSEGSRLVDATVADNGLGTVLSTTSDVEVANGSVQNNTIGLVAVARDNVYRSNVLEGNDIGLYSLEGEDAELAHNEFQANGYGVLLQEADGFQLSGNAFSEDGGLFVYGNRAYQFRHDVDRSNTVDGDPIVYLVGAEDRTIAPEQPLGMLGLVDARNVTVDAPSIAGNAEGILLAGGQDITVQDADVQDVHLGIAHLADVTDARIENATVESAHHAIAFELAGGNEVVNATVRDSEIGITALRSWNLALVDNTVEDNRFGTFVSFSIGAELTGNAMSGNDRNLLVDGGHPRFFHHDVGPSNTVDGAPVAYHVRDAPATIGPADDPGTVFLVETEDVLVHEVQLSGNGAGITTVGTEDTRIEDVEASDNVVGHLAHRDEDLTLEAAELADNDRGLVLSATDDVLVQDTRATGNDQGAVLGHASDTTIDNATFTRNDEAVNLTASSRSTHVTESTIEANDIGVRVNASVPGTEVVVEETVLEANTAFAVASEHHAYPVQAVENHWGALSGPSSPAGQRLVDPATGTPADGRGDRVTAGLEPGVANVRFDPVERPPTIEDPGDQATREERALSFQLNASDPDGDAVTWTAIGLPDGAEVTTDGDAATFAWTPDRGQAGTYEVAFEASDGIVSSRQTVEITVGTFNVPPVVDVADTAQAPPGGTVSITAEATDPDGPMPVRWETTTQPDVEPEPTVSRNDDGSVTWTWQVPDEPDAMPSVRFEADDGVDADVETTELVQLERPTVEIEDPVEISTGLGTTQLIPGEAVQLEATVADTDASIADVEIRPDGPDSTALDTALEGSTATAQTTYESTGEKTVWVRAEDTDGLAQTATMNVTVAENQPPVVDAGSDVITNATGPNGTRVSLAGAADDPEGRAIEPADYTWSMDGDPLEATGPRVEPELGVGNHTLTLQVEDAHGAVASDTVNVTVDDAVSLEFHRPSQEPVGPTDWPLFLFGLQTHARDHLTEVTMEIEVTHAPTEQVVTRMNASTGERGYGFVRLPTDLDPVQLNLEGDHRVTVAVEVPSQPGAPIQDTETAHVERTYTVAGTPGG